MRRPPVPKGPLAKLASPLFVAERRIARLRGFLLNLFFLMAVLLVIPLAAIGMFRAPVTIDPIAVPPVLVEQGYSGNVVANRLWEAVRQVNVEAGATRERLNPLPGTGRVEFILAGDVPSFSSLIDHVRRFFNASNTRIGGEFVCFETPCTRDKLRLRIRLLRSGMDVIEMPPMGSSTDDSYYKQAAAQVLRRLDPFVAASWSADHDSDQALADLHRLVKGSVADSKWALNLIGNIMGDRQLHDEAIASYRAALKLDPGYTVAMLNLARVTSDKGDQKEAIAIAQKALAAGGEPFFANMVLGQAEAAQGNIAVAAAAYGNAAAADPNSPSPDARLGSILSRSGDAVGAKSAYTRAIGIDPDCIEAHTGLAGLAITENNVGELLEQYREIRRLKPGDASAVADYASALVLNKNYDAAIASYRDALKLKPGDANWLNALGQLVRDRGQFADAEKLFLAAIAADPVQTVARFNLGDIYQRQGMRAEARAALTEYLRLAPHEPNAVLAKVYLAKLDR